ncbi:hypothetical protein ACWGNN_14095 [Streptomyces sp. NPDC055817]
MAAAPAVTASVVEIEEQDDEVGGESGEGREVVNKPRRRRPGRPGLSAGEVEEAIEHLNTAGDDVTPENLAKVLNRAPRTARRYLAQMKK